MARSAVERYGRIDILCQNTGIYFPSNNDRQLEGGWNPGQKLTLTEALRAYTFGSAYAAYREKEIGTLEVGKLADFETFPK